MGQFASLLQELRQRRVVRALVAYGAGAAAVLQGADMVFTALALPDLAYRLMVIASIAGFPLVAVLSWVYDLTAQGLRRTADIPPEQGRAPVPVGRYLQLVGAFTVSALIVFFTAGAVSHIRYPSSEDGRVGLAIFPLRTTGPVGEEWSEGPADLLSTALEGTASLRIVDPWSLWRPLRPKPSAAPRPPDPEEAAALTQEAGAHRFLLGSVVAVGDRLELTFRLYRVGRSEPLDAFTEPATPDGMTGAVRAAAVRVLARVWGPLRSPDVPAELDFNATQSPEALKAYLAAKEALRRGMVDSANSAIDRSLSLDSAFVLAMVDAVTIKSWNLFLQARPFTGFFELLARAKRFRAGLDERSRLRLEAMDAALRTNGTAAIAADERILEMDALDYDANAHLEYFRRAYGWQVRPPAYGSRELAERVVRLDSTQIPALAVREWWAVSLEDTADERAQLRRFELADTSGVLGRANVRSLRALLAGDAAFDRMLPQLTSLPLVQFTQLARHLRAGNLSRYSRYLDALVATPGAPMRPSALGERMRLDIAEGWATRADSMLGAGGYAADQPMARATMEMLIVAADLAQVSDRGAAERAVAWLSGYVPVDSAPAYFETRPVWWAGWLMGAWNGQVGDTTVARRWIKALGTLPPGGTSEDYRGALQADIEARLAARQGDPGSAIDLERTAMKLWTIHSDNDLESAPSPMMRLALALLLRDARQPEEAEALLSSLVLPTSWMGFVSARADFELGSLAAERGRRADAELHFRRALGLWGNGGPAVASWADRARAGLATAR
jgi:tetratricopeptide (TPR) repeat protein